MSYFENRKRKSPTKHLLVQKPVATMSKKDDQQPTKQKATLIEEEKLAEGVVSCKHCTCVGGDIAHVSEWGGDIAPVSEWGGDI